MKKQYRYFIAGPWIIRIWAWHVDRHPGRYCTYVEANEQLWDRADKYGYKRFALN